MKSDHIYQSCREIEVASFYLGHCVAILNLKYATAGIDLSAPGWLAAGSMHKVDRRRLRHRIYYNR